MHPFKTFVSLIALAAAAPALAGGFYLQEQSPLDVGRAFAGSAAIGDSAATVWYNPAGITQLPGANLELGAHLLEVESHQSDRGSTRSGPGGAGSFATGGNSGGNPFSQPVLVPSGYGSFQVTPRLWVGLGVSFPFGLKVVYDEQFFGRYDSIKSDLHDVNIQPSVAYKINDQISIGGGVDIQTLKADLESALPNLSPALPDGRIRIKGQDLAFGWNAGITANFGALKLGGHYRSHINHELDGNVEITGLLGPLAGSNGSRAGTAPISTPDIATVSAVFAVKPDLRLLGSVNWYNWSRFKRITVENASGAVFLDSEQRYRDTWSYSGAAEADISKKLTLRAGGMFDETPTRDGFRTTRVPDGNRIWATGGLTYHVSDRVALNTSYAHVFVATRQIDRGDPLFAGTPAVINVRTRSENSGNVDMVAGSVSLRF